MNNKVVYTSLVGSYDSLVNPQYIMDGWDYICFSNDVRDAKGLIWEVRKIPFEGTNNLRLSRFAKLNPDLVLSEYDISLYMDANLVMIDDSVEKILADLIMSNVLISIPKHPIRECIYDEAQVCIREGKDSLKLILNQINFLKQQNFPTKQGLFENNIIFRRHNRDEIKRLSKNWWQLYIAYSRRDQLSLVYLLWKFQIECKVFFKEGECAKSFNGVKYIEHNESLMSRIKRSLNIRVNKFCAK
jgi:hypothetical protein